jgi:hypothetical protein
VIIFLAVCTALLGVGVIWGGVTGLYWMLAAFTIAMLTQTIWLWLRSRLDEKQVKERDQAIILVTPPQVEVG